jgi:hypothetical protein
MTKQERIQLHKTNHLAQLKAIGFIGNFDKLRKLERQVTQCSLWYCNGKLTTEKFGQKIDAFTDELKTFFINNELPQGVYINTDPRGYALKLDSDENPFIQGEYRNKINSRDWGGNGILAPDNDYWS